MFKYHINVFVCVCMIMYVNPLTPVPAVTGREKSTWGQLPLLPSLKTYWFSYCSNVFEDK